MASIARDTRSETPQHQNRDQVDEQQKRPLFLDLSSALKLDTHWAMPNAYRMRRYCSTVGLPVQQLLAARHGKK